jgi:predicted transcriptional regulator
MQHRNRTQIVAAILSALKEKETVRSRLIYAVRITWQQLCEYVAMLTYHQLIQINAENHKLKATPKGLAYLKIYEAMISEFPNL